VTKPVKSTACRWEGTGSRKNQSQKTLHTGEQLSFEAKGSYDEEERIYVA
jgi:hypothetical protein